MPASSEPVLLNQTRERKQESDTTLTAVRRILLLTFILAACGTGIELMLVGHIEDAWQWVPQALLLISIVLLLFYAVSRRPLYMRFFQLTMFLFMISGVVGIWLHYQSKVEFKLELNPSLHGLDLFLDAIKGATLPPVLAPGMMIQLGLVGLVYSFRHPALLTNTKKNEPVEL